jgi:NADP-dependent 3-hydroxy acid dehydrogenase YdfG
MTNREKAVLITGASTGIGRATALRLDDGGYRVFAGERKEEDVQALRDAASHALTPLLLDVTDEEAVAEVLTSRKAKPQYLVGPGARKMRNLARLPRSLRGGLMYRALYGAKR